MSRLTREGAGNLTKKLTAGGAAWEYLWDARDKMTKVRKQPCGGAMADVAAYTYDAMGRRFQKTAAGTTTTCYQDGLPPNKPNQPNVGQPPPAVGLGIGADTYGFGGLTSISARATGEISRVSRASP